MCAALRPVFKGSDSPFFTCPCWVKWDLLCQAPRGRQTRTEERLLTLKYRYQPQISLTKKERNTMDQPPYQKLCWYSAGITPVLCGYICVLLGAVNLTHQWMKTTFNSFSSWKTEVQSGCHTIKWFSIKVLAGLGASESFRGRTFLCLVQLWRPLIVLSSRASFSTSRLTSVCRAFLQWPAHWSTVLLIHPTK